MIPFSQEPGDDTPQLAAATEFDAQLAAVQPRLRGYVASLLGGWSAVDDIVQDVSMVLIEKREKFVPHTNFAAWAFRVAYFKAANWRRDMQREGRVMFREDFFQHAAAVAEEHFTDDHGMHEALRQCLKQLPPEDRALVVRKYADQESLVSQAEASGRKANTLHKAISRIRLVLRECIRRQLAGDTRPPSPTP